MFDSLEARFNKILVQFQKTATSKKSLLNEQEEIVLKLIEIDEDIGVCKGLVPMAE